MTKHQRKYKTIDNLKVCHDLDVKGNSELEGDVKVGGDLTVKKDLVVKGTTTFKGDITPVSGTFSPGTKQFPTIQSIFDFMKGKAVDDALIIIPSPASGVVTYDELLDTRGIISTPSQGQVLPPENYPLVNFSDLTFLQRGLGIRGDPRYYAGLIYISGAQLNYFMDFNYTTNVYVQQLGTPFGLVLLSNPSINQIQVDITAVPANVPSETNISGPPPQQNPNFSTVDIQIGDHILIRDINGVYNERTITAVGTNVLSYDGADVPQVNLGVGASLILCPRVKITSSIPVPDGGIVLWACGIATQGIWFQGNGSGGDVVEVWYDAVVKTSSCLYDGTNNMGTSLIVGYNSEVGSEVSGIRQHNTILSNNNSLAGFGVLDEGSVDDGDWCVLDGNVNIYIREAISHGLFNSVNAVGAFEANFLIESNATCKITGLLGCYNSQGGGGFGSVAVARAGRIALYYDNVQIDNTLTGAHGLDVSRGGQFAVSATPVYPSTITGCSVGIISRGGSEVVFENGSQTVQLQNLDLGIEIIDASSVIFANNVSYTNVVDPYYVEVNSLYSAVNSSATPGGIFSYGVAGSATLDSAENQAITAPGSVSLSLDPSDSSYLGKHYYLYAYNGVANSLTLVAPATFVGAGVTASGQSVLNIDAIVGAGAHLLVVNATIVQVVSVVNASASLFSAAVIAAKSVPQKKSKVVAPSQKLDKQVSIRRARFS